MTPTASYKMTKATKTWLAVNKARLPADRFSSVKRSLIQADLTAASPVRSNRRDDK